MGRGGSMHPGRLTPPPGSRALEICSTEPYQTNLAATYAVNVYVCIRRRHGEAESSNTDLHLSFTNYAPPPRQAREYFRHGRFLQLTLVSLVETAPRHRGTFGFLFWGFFFVVGEGGGGGQDRFHGYGLLVLAKSLCSRVVQPKELQVRAGRVFSRPIDHHERRGSETAYLDLGSPIQ
ncbi:hypothetical protein LX32DRAFT_278671 [Colletotrichum zoysiae]|uniref:Uncharacterized protein n=1 Tax=Colletotrichum zoysiae TaxID=1216348 RepID=A0AAD9H494_9PEZI|nr:hypothetical protein LX32DRAFT_278671 [Colletotrichum zoysiae]